MLLQKEGFSGREAVECLIDRALGSEQALVGMIKQNKFRKLNVVLDLDNTLVHSFTSAEHEKMLKDPRVRKTRQGYSLVFRNKLIEFLRYISQFCNLYLHSFGAKSYVHDVITLLQEDEKKPFFRSAITSPNDNLASKEAFDHRNKGKRIKDFAELDCPDERKRSLIIDD